MSVSSASSSQGASSLPEAKRCRVVPEDDASACAPTASTFTERCSNDSVTLSLVLGCLDVYSIVRARRVCRTWQAATRAPLTWSHCSLAVQAQHVACIPVSSVALLRRLTVAFGCKWGCDMLYTVADMSPDQRELFGWMGQLRGLRSLSIRGIVVDAELCDMLFVHAAGIRELDLALCHEIMRPNVRRQSSVGNSDRRQTENLSSANNGEHDAQDGLLSAVATSASQEVKDAMAYMRLPQAADEPRLPTLRMPQLTSLRLPSSSSYRDVLSLIAPLHKLQSLQLQRYCLCSKDTAVGKSYYMALMNRLFAHTYADTLTHLTLFGMEEFESYRFELLHNLTHLSLRQDQFRGGLTCAALRAVAALPRLERCEIHVEWMGIHLCLDPEWWRALAGVRSLVALSVSGYICFGADKAVNICLGLEHVMQNSDIRLEELKLDLLHPAHMRYAMKLNYPHLHTLVARVDVCVASAASLARMPRLTSLDMPKMSRDLPGIIALLRALPRLRTLRCHPIISRSRSYHRACSVDRDVWLAFVNMPALTSLQLDHMSNVDDDFVELLCDAATSRPPAPDAMRAFMGGAPPDRGSTPQLALQHLRFNSKAITPDQCRRLLRSMPQLQLLYVDNLGSRAAHPLCARVFVDAQRTRSSIVV